MSGGVSDCGMNGQDSDSQYFTVRHPRYAEGIDIDRSIVII